MTFNLMWLNKNDHEGKWAREWRRFTKPGWPIRRYASLGPTQRVNHFPGTEALDDKAKLAAGLSEMARRFPAWFDGSQRVHPRSFVMPDDIEALRETLLEKDAAAPWWLLKPPNGGSGKGIRLVTRDELFRTARDELRPYVCQEYVANPHLIDGLKYDLRVFVLVTSFEPLVAYLFDDGVVKFCTTPYGTDLDDPYMHLANNGLNKTSPRYDAAKHRRSLRAVLSSIEEQKTGGADRVKRSLIETVQKTLLSGTRRIVRCTQSAGCPRRGRCFEIFGFDVLVDASLRTWLCEVNNNPLYGNGTPSDNALFGKMLSEAWHIVGLPVAEDARAIGDTVRDVTNDVLDEFDRSVGLGFRRIFPTAATSSFYRCLAEGQNDDDDDDGDDAGLNPYDAEIRRLVCKNE